MNTRHSKLETLLELWVLLVRLQSMASRHSDIRFTTMETRAQLCIRTLLVPIF